MDCEIPLRIEDVVNLLARTPAVLRTLLGGLPEDWIRHNYGPETFSPFDVVGHLACAERDNWMPRLRIILNDGPSRPLATFDRYAMYTTCRGKSLAEVLDDFERCRRASLAELRGLNLSEAQLDCRGRHPELGEVTARQLLATWVVHDLNHLHQVAKCLAWQYRIEMGPWRPYVGVLPPDA